MPQNRKLMLLLNIVFHKNNTASGGEFDREGKEGVKEKVTKDGRGEGAKLKFVFYVILLNGLAFFSPKNLLYKCSWLTGFSRKNLRELVFFCWSQIVQGQYFKYISLL